MLLCSHLLTMCIVTTIMHQVSTGLYQCCFNLNDISNYRSEVILNLLLLNYTVTYVILSSRVLRKITSFHDGTP